MVVFDVSRIDAYFLAIHFKFISGLEAQAINGSGTLHRQEEHPPLMLGLAHEILAVLASALGAGLEGFGLVPAAVEANVPSFRALVAFEFAVKSAFFTPSAHGSPLSSTIRHDCKRLFHDVNRKSDFNQKII